MYNKTTKKLIKTFSINQQNLKSIKRNKSRYMLDLHNGRQTFIHGDIYEKEFEYQVNFFITMYGFMDYFCKIKKDQSSEYSKNFIISHMLSVLNEETFNKFNDMIKMLPDKIIEDITNNQELALFKVAYNKGFNLAPHANKLEVEKKYLKLYYDLLNNYEFLDEKLEKTGNSKQLKKIAYTTRKHIETKRS